MTIKNKPVKMTLAHINDTHSYFEPHSLQLALTIDNQEINPYVSNGGFARIKTRADQIREQAQINGREFLLFHAGDCFQGTLYFSLFKGRANADLLNALRIDAMALGNHELDMGNQPVVDFLDRIDFPILAGNWDVSSEDDNKKDKLRDRKNLYPYMPEQGTAKWMIRYVQQEPVAIFGVSMDLMADIANPDPDTPFANTMETVKNTVAAINKQGVNKIILISHLGFEADKDLANEVEGIGLIIGGHSHTLQGDFSALGMERQGEYGELVNNTRIVQSGLYAQAIGHCEIDFDAQGRVTHFSGRNELLFGRRLCIDASLSQANTDTLHKKALAFLHQQAQVVICKKDPKVQEILSEKYIPRVRRLQQTTIAQAERPLRHVRIPDIHGGSEIMPLVAESFYHTMRGEGHPVQFALHNAGGVRTSINPGPVSEADIAGKLLPFAVPIGVYRIKGKYLALALEGAIDNATNNGVIGTGSGSYPYAYNLDFEYEPSLPSGERITKLHVFDEDNGWQTVDREQDYCGTSSAYTMKGKEGYSALTKMSGNGIVTRHSMADCFINLLKSQPDKLSNDQMLTQNLG